MADHAPLLTSENYATLLTSRISGRLEDTSKHFDPAYVTATNVPTNSIRWNSALNRDEKWDGTTWSVKSTGYAINITGSAASCTGNAATVTNGVYTTGTYSDPAWLSTLASTKITGDIPSAQTTFSQSGAGAIVSNVQNKLREYVDVKDFGADGDGVVDATAAINAAIDHAFAQSKPVVAAGVFRISGKIVFKGNADFSDAILNVYGAPAIAVEISTGSGANPTSILLNCTVYLPKRIINIAKPATGWAGQGIGVRVVNANNCKIYVGNVRNFQTGLLCTSYGTGSVDSLYFLGDIENNQENIRLEPGNAAGWVNSNLFIGGRLGFYSAEGAVVTGCYDIHIPVSTNVVNSNVFIGVNVEGDTPELQVKCAGSYNTFRDMRWESTSPKVQFFGTTTNHGTRNAIDCGYRVDDVVVSYSGTTGKNNKLEGAGTEVLELGTSSKSLRYQNVSSSSAAIRRFFEAGTNPWSNGTNWSVSESSQAFEAKRAADANPRIKLDYVNGRLFLGNGTVAPTASIGAFGATSIASSNHWLPATDNTLDLGDPSYRWSVVRAGTGTINTSDAREKQQIRSLSAVEQAVAGRLKASIKAFKFNDAVLAKGANARIHVGVIAQDVVAAFAAEGLDASKYAMLCYDEWPDKLDEFGNIIAPAGNRYGVRYEELLAFIVSAL